MGPFQCQTNSVNEMKAYNKALTEL